ncbi:nucleotide sugar dehydrogenase [Gammaproteobacteria bacterium]|nr:nucleotide sugar dehydrogenase [Gammaproteobacteria bacterium]
MKSSESKEKIAVIGLGYVGLPLMYELTKKFTTIGFDISKSRVEALKKGIDITGELNAKQLNKISKNLTFSTQDIEECSTYIVSVPTPIKKNKLPDLDPINQACKLVGGLLKKGNLIIFESTVYPGLTEDHCVPLLEKTSNLTYQDDFSVGYSPERINPGDKIHTLTSIIKIVSGSNKKTLTRVNNIYSKIIKAGTYQAPSIKVAEAAKVIENTQRDINIALINELSQIFNLLKIDTNEVLSAAKTKWNFNDFKPGLVGGHCIGVDPYYLTHKASEIGFHPKMILSGRETNEYMPHYIVKESIASLKKSKLSPKNLSALVVGLTFKENCPDIRNSKSLDVLNILSKSFKSVDAYDPLIDIAKLDLGLHKKVKVLKKIPTSKKYHLIILSSPHDVLLKLGSKYFDDLKAKNGVFFDVKSSFGNSIDSLSL